MDTAALIFRGARARLAEIESEVKELLDIIGDGATEQEIAMWKPRFDVPARPAAPKPLKKKRTMSAKARAAISAAQKARWAKAKKAKT